MIREKQGEYFGLDSQVRKEVEEEMQKMKDMRYEMLNLKTSNPLIPAAAEFVELKSDPVLGRQLLSVKMLLQVAEILNLVVLGQVILTRKQESEWV